MSVFMFLSWPAHVWIVFCAYLCGIDIMFGEEL